MENREEEVSDLGIFQNQEDVVENIKKSAEAIGAEISDGAIERLKEGKPLETFVAKKNCKMCNGLGTVDYVPNRRNTKQPEDFKGRDWRDENMVRALCGCVKRRLE